MIWIYVFMIALAAFPLLLTIKRMRTAIRIKKEGIHVDGIVNSIRTVRTGKTYVDIVTFQYTDRATGMVYPGRATVGYQKMKYSDRIPVAYLPANPGKYAVANTSYWMVLIFCIVLFAFVIFAVYKINEMVKDKDIRFTGAVIYNHPMTMISE